MLLRSAWVNCIFYYMPVCATYDYIWLAWTNCDCLKTKQNKSKQQQRKHRYLKLFHLEQAGTQPSDPYSPTGAGRSLVVFVTLPFATEAWSLVLSISQTTL